MSFERKVSKRLRNLFRLARNRRRNFQPTSPYSRLTQGFESLEQRLLLLTNLKYADLAATPPLTTAGITGYLASVVSTNYTLRAEQDSGLVWRLYVTGTDLVPIPSTKVLEAPIGAPADLDFTVQRDDL